MQKSSIQLLILVGGLVVAGCGGSDNNSTSSGNTGGTVGVGGGSSGSGGASNSTTGAILGGAPNSGGTTAAVSGGTVGAGGAAVGGASAAGGNPSTGGTQAAGGASAAGGAATIGGTKAAGGASATGGTKSVGSAAGGTIAGGGASATGGAIAVGGSSAVAAGGTKAAGGASSTGGSAATAGTQATGGAGNTTGGSTAAGGTTCGAPTVSLTGADAVVGKLIQFNDNGGWCWYQDERAVVDTAANKLIIASVASGGTRDSDQEAVIYDITAGTSKRYTLETDQNPDDHNAPGITILPDGTYAAIWATHRDTCLSYYSVFSGSSWATYKTYDWTGDGCPWDTASNPNPPHKVTYANPWYLSAEDKILSPTRSVSTSPAMLQSTDGGKSWKFYGRLTSSPTVGYVAGYYKYWGNGVDRIDFVGTEAHPRDNDNSLWHGYYKGGKLYNSADVVIDSNAGDTSAQDISKFTKVFGTGTTLNSKSFCRMWNHDITRYEDGTIAILGQGRVDNCTSTPSGSDPDKRLIYSRWDGTSWKTTYLVHAGPKLYADEQDYTGLGALDPDDPTTIYISTPYDPSTDTLKTGAKREIWRGTTCDNGATFKWTPVTANSTKDNIRPIVPKWDASHTALLWMKGEYRKSQDYTEVIQGTISSK